MFFKKIIVFLPVIFFCLTSCGDTTIIHGTPLYGEIVGYLYHKEYWDQNDSWDLRNLQIRIYFEDETYGYIDALDNHITYTFSPATPNNLDYSTTSFTVEEGVYKDNNVTFKIRSRVFNDIKIVEFPYKNKNNGLLTTYTKIVIVIGLFVLTVLISLLFVKRNNVLRKRGK